MLAAIGSHRPDIVERDDLDRLGRFDHDDRAQFKLLVGLLQFERSQIRRGSPDAFDPAQYIREPLRRTGEERLRLGRDALQPTGVGRHPVLGDGQGLGDLVKVRADRVERLPVTRDVLGLQFIHGLLHRFRFLDHDLQVVLNHRQFTHLLQGRLCVEQSRHLGLLVLEQHTNLFGQRRVQCQRFLVRQRFALVSRLGLDALQKRTQQGRFVRWVDHCRRDLLATGRVVQVEQVGHASAVLLGVRTNLTECERVEPGQSQVGIHSSDKVLGP